MPLSSEQCDEISQYLTTIYNATFIDLVLAMINTIDNPIGIFTEILEIFMNHNRCNEEANQIILQRAREQYSVQLGTLASKGSGWHFSALNAKARKIEDLDLETVLYEMQQIAPDLCVLISDLMSADRKLAARRLELAAVRERKAAALKRRRAERAARNVRAADVGVAAAEPGSDEELWQSVGDAPMLEGEEQDDDEQLLWAQLPNISEGDLDAIDKDAYWRQEFEPHIPEDPADETSAHDVDRALERRNSLMKIVRLISIFCERLNNELTVMSCRKPSYA